MNNTQKFRWCVLRVAGWVTWILALYLLVTAFNQQTTTLTVILLISAFSLVVSGWCAQYKASMIQDVEVGQ